MSSIGMGFVLIWVLPMLPAQWIYNQLAIHKAFGRDAGQLPQVTVKSIEKPSTVTFSNGAVVDVGLVPATVSSTFHLVVSIVGAGFFYYKFRGQIRALSKTALTPAAK